MRMRSHQWDLDAELVFDRYLGSGEDLDVLQELLRQLVPRWAAKLRVWRGPKDQRPVDIHEPGALKSTVVTAAGERGATYRALVAQYGHPPHERLVGSAELRGAGPELVIIVSIDEMVVSQLGARTALGNGVTLQVRRREVEGRQGKDWLAEAFETLCAALSPPWASAQHPDEYWAKVMIEEPRIEAVGRDFGRSLPGVFWLNFFGRRYRELLGNDRLLSTPAPIVSAVGDGVLVGLGGDPTAWATEAYARAEAKVRDHLGAEFFFAKSDPDRLTVAPDWLG